MLRPLLKHLGLFTLYGLLGLTLGVLSYFILDLNARPALQAWHTAQLKAEYRAGQASATPTLAAYQALEERLFAELDRAVYAQAQPGAASRLQRFAPGSLADLRGRQPDWNRTVILKAAQARGAALLLHGLTDSPYSLRATALHLQAQGWSVVVLRLPGHGTAPLALLDVKLADWQAAVRMAAQDLVAQVGQDKPFVLLGYSNGAALALDYALTQAQEQKLPRPHGLVMISPAIGLPEKARLARWQTQLARLPGLRQLAWLELYPEYDPFKYNSFTANAADQAWQLTQSLQTRLDTRAAALPPILALQSVADATVSTQAVLDNLFFKLPAGQGHQLLLFDANRLSSTRPLLQPAVFALREQLLNGPALGFDLTVISNSREDSEDLSAWQRAAGHTQTVAQPLGLRWPAGVYSLSHVALPFTPEDPLYGAEPPAPGSHIYLGKLALFGEKQLAMVPAASLLRLRHNPFYRYQQAEVDSFLSRLDQRSARP